MTGKVFLICGKICCGKTYYAEKLRREHSAVLLSVDEITLAVFGQHIGEKHDEVCENVRKYLFEKSLEIADTGINVILDWGFWRKEDRDYARDFYKENGVPCELHYVDISDKTWRENIAERNKNITEGKTSAYYVDDNLLKKLEGRFEPPEDGEIDVFYTNERP